MRIKEKKGYKRCQNIRGVINEQAQINAFLKKVLNHHDYLASVSNVEANFIILVQTRRRFY